MNEATQTTADLATQLTTTVDGIAGTIAPIADVLGPLVGPKVALYAPWLAAALVVAVPVAVALWPLLYRLAEVIPGNLDTWLLDRIGALLERLARWVLRREVKLVLTGELTGELTERDTTEIAAAAVELGESETSDSLDDV